MKLNNGWFVVMASALMLPFMSAQAAESCADRPDGRCVQQGKEMTPEQFEQIKAHRLDKLGRLTACVKESGNQAEMRACGEAARRHAKRPSAPVDGGV